MPDPTTEAQRVVAERVVAEEIDKRPTLLIALTGAHAYGFASVDSDLDLKGIWEGPARGFLGLGRPPGAVDRQEWIDGVEVDFTVNELGQAVSGLLKGNGNMLERLFDPSPLHIGDRATVDSLRAATRAALSKRCYHHYRGFAHSQRKAVDPAAPQAKKVLYVLRTTTTGAHLLETGEVIADLTALHDRYGFPEVPELIAHKRAAERGALPSEWTAERVDGLLDRAFARLETAREASGLPDQPSPEAAAALEHWLITRRIAKL